MSLVFFFFQAEDGIRDLTVTGVQTCALPIYHVVPGGADEPTARDALERTMRWLGRCRKRHAELTASHDNQTLSPILQGGAHVQLRTEGLRRILDLGDWTGLAIGSRSVAEPEAR